VLLKSTCKINHKCCSFKVLASSKIFLVNVLHEPNTIDRVLDLVDSVPEPLNEIPTGVATETHGSRSPGVDTLEN
jgi:hypothetical protein